MELMRSHFDDLKRILDEFQLVAGLATATKKGNIYSLIDQHGMYVGNQYLKRRAKRVRKEAERNLLESIPLNIQIDYLNEILKFYKLIDEQIYEDENGNCSSDFFSLIKIPDKERSLEIKMSYRLFLNETKKATGKEIVYYLRLIKSAKSDIIEKLRSTINKNAPKSFKLLNRPGFVFEDKIPEVFNKLENFGFILKGSDNDKTSFKRLFSKEGVETPIIWNDSNGLLHYFFDRLAEAKIIKISKQIDWSIAEHAFYRKEIGKQYKSGSLCRAKPMDTAEDKREKIDKIVAFLMS